MILLFLLLSKKVKSAIIDCLEAFMLLEKKALVEGRISKFRAIGKYKL